MQDAHAVVDKMTSVAGVYWHRAKLGWVSKKGTCGVHFTAAGSAPDLGIERGHRRRHIRSKHSSRVKAALYQAKQLKKDHEAALKEVNKNCAGAIRDRIQGFARRCHEMQSHWQTWRPRGGL